MCQFVPTSVLEHAADGDHDGKVDLNTPKDAIYSVGRYLQNHGWRPGLKRREQVLVLLTYNQSRPYARTVLELARRIR
jgi:membrane-bound lytic murein transglycosylase B